MFSRRSNELNHGRPSPLKQLSCIFSLGMPPHDEQRLIQEREFHYKQVQQRHRKNSTTLTSADSFSISNQSSFSSIRRRSRSADCAPTPLGGGVVCIPDDPADVLFHAHFPEQSFTVTEICLDGEAGDGEDYVEIDEDGCVSAPLRTTCVLRCDDNSVWSDVSDEYATTTVAASKTVASHHWHEGDASKPFVAPYEIVIVRKHVQFRFEI